MADINKRFKIGNTTVNLGKVDLVGDLQHIQCVRYNTIPYCVNQITRVEIECPRNSRLVTLDCPGNSRLVIDFTDRIRTVQLTPQLRLEEVEVFKAELMEELKVLEAHEMALKELETPQSMKEIEAVEDNLVNSLAEVQKLKEEFSKNN